MRTRSWDNSGPTVSWQLDKQLWNPTCTSPGYTGTIYDSGTFQPFVNTKVMHDVVTPRFKLLMKKGMIINNPMDSTELFYRDNLCYTLTDYSHKWKANTCNPVKWLTYRNLVSGTRPSSNLIGDCGFLPAPSLDVNDLIDLAVAKAWSRVSASEAQVLVMLAEGEKTVASLVQIFIRLLKILRAVKRLDIKTLCKELTAKELARRYLELRYSLRPLLHDAHDCITAFATTAKTIDDRLTFRAKENASVNDSDVLTNTNTWTNSTGTWSRSSHTYRLTSRVVDVRAGVLTQVGVISKLNIWGFYSPVEAMWELIPFSFIVDWFFNVGQTIASWTPECGLKTLASWYSVSDTLSQSNLLTDASSTMPVGDATHSAISNVYTVSDCFMERISVTKYRVPNPSRAILPTFKLRLDSFKLLDLVLIGRQLFA